MIELVLTPEQVAEEFAEMDSDQKVRFFNRLGTLFYGWAEAEDGQQLQMVAESSELTAAGLGNMAAIGWVAEERAVSDEESAEDED